MTVCSCFVADQNRTQGLAWNPEISTGTGRCPALWCSVRL